jgi:excisionase family DNA binding protein
MSMDFDINSVLDELVERLVPRIVDEVVRRLEAAMGRASGETRLLDVAEAAQRLGRSRQALYKLVERHRLPATHVDGRLQFSSAVIDAFVAGDGDRLRQIQAEQTTRVAAAARAAAPAASARGRSVRPRPLPAVVPLLPAECPITGGSAVLRVGGSPAKPTTHAASRAIGFAQRAISAAADDIAAGVEIGRVGRPGSQPLIGAPAAARPAAPVAQTAGAGAVARPAPPVSWPAAAGALTDGPRQRPGRGYRPWGSWLRRAAAGPAGTPPPSWGLLRGFRKEAGGGAGSTSRSLSAYATEALALLGASSKPAGTPGIRTGSLGDAFGSDDELDVNSDVDLACLDDGLGAE